MVTTQVARWRLAALLLIALGSSLLRAQSAEVDEPPVPVKSVRPDYPQEMMQEKVSALVTVRLVIDENGDVIESSVVKSTRPEFEAAALEAVAKWKFKPARKAGASVRAKIALPIKFTYDS